MKNIIVFLICFDIRQNASVLASTGRKRASKEQNVHFEEPSLGSRQSRSFDFPSHAIHSYGIELAQPKRTTNIQPTWRRSRRIRIRRRPHSFIRAAFVWLASLTFALDHRSPQRLHPNTDLTRCRNHRLTDPSATNSSQVLVTGSLFRLGVKRRPPKSL